MVPGSLHGPGHCSMLHRSTTFVQNVHLCSPHMLGGLQQQAPRTTMAVAAAATGGATLQRPSTTSSAAVQSRQVDMARINSGKGASTSAASAGVSKQDAVLAAAAAVLSNRQGGTSAVTGDAALAAAAAKQQVGKRKKKKGKSPHPSADAASAADGGVADPTSSSEEELNDGSNGTAPSLSAGSSNTSNSTGSDNSSGAGAATSKKGPQKARSPQPQPSPAAAAFATATAYPSLPAPPATGPPPKGIKGVNIKVLETEVKATTNVEELEAQFRRHKATLEAPGATLMCNQLACFSDPAKMSVRVWTQTQALLAQLLEFIEPRMPTMSEEEFMVVLAAVAKLQHTPTSPWLSAWFKHSTPTLKKAGPGHQTMLLRALSRLDVKWYDIKETEGFGAWIAAWLNMAKVKMVMYRGDELVSIAMSLGELRYRPPAEFMSHYSKCLETKLETLGSEGLSKAVLAFAHMRYSPEPKLLKSYYAEVYQKMPLFDDRDLASFAQACAMTKRLVKQDFLKELLMEVHSKLPVFQLGALSHLLGAIGELGVLSKAEAPWIYAMGAKVKQHMWEFGGNNLAIAVNGLTRMGYPASREFMELYVAASTTKLHTMMTADFIQAITVLSRSRVPPRELRNINVWIAEFEKLAARRTFDTTQVCDLMAAVASIGYSPSPHFLHAVLRHTRMYNLRCTSPSKIAGLGQSLQKLGLQPSWGFMQNYLQAARFHWSSFQPAEYAKVLSALASFGPFLCSDPMWAADFMAIIRCRLPTFTGEALAQTLSACSRLGGEFQPSTPWIQAAAAQLHAESTAGRVAPLYLADSLLALADLGHRFSDVQVLYGYATFLAWQGVLLPEGEVVPEQSGVGAHATGSEARVTGSRMENGGSVGSSSDSSGNGSSGGGSSGGAGGAQSAASVQPAAPASMVTVDGKSGGGPGSGGSGSSRDDGRALPVRTSELSADSSSGSSANGASSVAQQSLGSLAHTDRNGGAQGSTLATSSGNSGSSSSSSSGDSRSHKSTSHPFASVGRATPSPLAATPNYSNAQVALSKQLHNLLLHSGCEMQTLQSLVRKQADARAVAVAAAAAARSAAQAARAAAQANSGAATAAAANAGARTPLSSLTSMSSMSSMDEYDGGMVVRVADPTVSSNASAQSPHTGVSGGGAPGSNAASGGAAQGSIGGGVGGSGGAGAGAGAGSGSAGGVAPMRRSLFVQAAPSGGGLAAAPIRPGSTLPTQPASADPVPTGEVGSLHSSANSAGSGGSGGSSFSSSALLAAPTRTARPYVRPPPLPPASDSQAPAVD